MLSNVTLANLPARAGDRPARFGLELSSGQDSRALTATILGQLAEFEPTIRPITPLDHGVLILELRAVKIEGAEPAVAFAAGYALADDFALRTAEPDLTTSFFFQEPEPPPTGIRAGLPGGFPPGCWVAREDQLATDWALNRINAPDAWQFSLDEGRPPYGRGVVIAQPDTGIVPHIELKDVPRQGGYDVVGNDDDPTDPLTGRYAGHGTGTASVVVSPSSAGRITGSAPAATHMPIRAVNTVVRVSQISVAEAVEHAVDNRAHIISMSLGGVSSDLLLRALERAIAADVVVLAAAGNCVRFVVWPARYDQCIAVGGTAADDSMWRGSCRGPEVDIAAPAQNVYRAEVSGQGFVGESSEIGQGQGTSYAVALTAGVAGLWLAHHGRSDLIAAARARNETLQQLFVRLLRATARRPAGWDPTKLGAGIVNAQALLSADLDLGRDTESPETPPRVADDMRSVASFIAETVGADAVPGPGFDWTRYGPELANALMTQAVEGRETRIVLSDQLTAAIDNPRLRDRLGYQ